MPPGIPFIVVNEFAERFCFYGINAMLTLFLVQYLHFGEAEGATWGSLFKFGAYSFPLLGAIVSDVFLGKFRTVLAFSLVYVVGCVALALSRFVCELRCGLARPEICQKPESFQIRRGIIAHRVEKRDLPGGSYRTITLLDIVVGQ